MRSALPCRKSINSAPARLPHRDQPHRARLVVPAADIISRRPQPPRPRLRRVECHALLDAHAFRAGQHRFGHAIIQPDAQSRGHALIDADDDTEGRLVARDVGRVVANRRFYWWTLTPVRPAGGGVWTSAGSEKGPDSAVVDRAPAPPGPTAMPTSV